MKCVQDFVCADFRCSRSRTALSIKIPSTLAATVSLPCRQMYRHREWPRPKTAASQKAFFSINQHARRRLIRRILHRLHSKCDWVFKIDLQFPFPLLPFKEVQMVPEGVDIMKNNFCSFIIPMCQFSVIYISSSASANDTSNEIFSAPGQATHWRRIHHYRDQVQPHPLTENYYLVSG